MDGRIAARDAGFTLVELMIVVALLAILTTSVTLSANRPFNGSQSDVARFMALHERLRSQAILSRQIVGLRVDADGYHALLWTGSEWAEVGSEHAWQEAVIILEPRDLRQPLQFGPGGQSTPVFLRFEGADRVQQCRSDGWSGVSCVAG